MTLFSYGAPNQIRLEEGYIALALGHILLERPGPRSYITSKKRPNRRAELGTYVLYG